MRKVVAFLRGINVGGYNVIKKDKLQEFFASMSFTNVSVYKQSGNAIFETNATDLERLQKEIHRKLTALSGCDIGVFLRTTAQLQEIAENNPFKIVNEKGVSFLVTFSSCKLPQTALPIKIPKSSAEIILIRGFEAYSVTRGHGDGGKPNRYIESKFKTQATTRNWNITKEITRLCD